MRFMIIVPASAESEAGQLPSEQARRQELALDGRTNQKARWRHERPGKRRQSHDTNREKKERRDRRADIRNEI